MNAAAPFCLIAAGGTGGHMFPAQSLAETLLAQGWRVKLSTDERGARYAGAFPPEVVREVVSSATTARGGIAAKLAVPFRIGAGVLAAIRAFRADRPAVVVGFGGYPTIPAMSAACLLKVPRMIHEQNGVMGRVNAGFARRVDRVACGTWPTVLPAGVEGIHTGNPVRRAVLDMAATPYHPPGEGVLNVLVIGGSQGARVLSDQVPEAIAGLPDEMRARLNVSHQARAEDAARAQEEAAQAMEQLVAQEERTASALTSAVRGLSSRLGIDTLQGAVNDMAVSDTRAPTQRLAAARGQAEVPGVYKGNWDATARSKATSAPCSPCPTACSRCWALAARRSPRARSSSRCLSRPTAH